MYLILLLLSSSFVIISSEKIECPDDCTLPLDRVRKLCNYSYPDSDNTEKRQTRTRSESFDMKPNRHVALGVSDVPKHKTDIFDLMSKTSEDSPRPLTGQQLQNLEKYALYDYYLRALNNYE